MSKFERPPGVSEDPEFCYRSGYQHGALAVLEALQARTADQERLRAWVEIDLQKWRHDPEAVPRPPAI
jgi:hypothetical protein